ncbi:hypothetical protein GOODEAATRI_031940 [Goodea atripinnis]|uniref:G-protein coupled receptors family 1 profile domain-containing protein n=1 Tax=Goodea atripinnis TaxID=208336 RepID=A0ABV0PIW5_9TELE
MISNHLQSEELQKLEDLGMAELLCFKDKITELHTEGTETQVNERQASRRGGFLCMSVHVIYTVNLCSSVLILAFISLDRYLPVVCATDSQAARKLLASRVIYVGVWLPAAILTVPDLVFARVQDVRNVSSSGYI